MIRSSLGMAVAITAFLAPQAAWAGGPNERAADAALEEGVRLVAQGKLAEGCEKMEQSEKLVPSGRAALNVADCWERRGLLTAARAKFLEAAARAIEAGRPDAERHARERAERIEPRLARILVNAPGAGVSSGLRVSLDGQFLSSAQLGSPELVDPRSPHTIEATADNGRHFKSVVTAEEGRTLTVDVDFASKEKPMAATDRVTPTPAPSSTSFVPVVAALGIGVLGLGIAGFSGLQMSDARSTVDAHCNAARECDAEGVDAASRGRTFGIVAPVALVAGVGGLAAGTWLWLRRPASAPRSSQTTFAPLPSKDALGVMATGSF